MHRKILGLCAALVALGALAIAPAMASASPVLTENGTAVSAGAGITATGEETSTFSSGFISVECNDFWMTGAVAKNTGSNIEGTIEKASFNWLNGSTTEDCHSNVGATKVTIPGLTNEGGTEHWCIVSNSEMAANEAQVLPHSCGGSGGAFTFILDVTNAPLLGPQTCKYTRSEPIKVTYNTNTAPVTTKLKENTSFTLETGSSGSCSTTGSLTKMNFTLETDVSPFTALSIS